MMLDSKALAGIPLLPANTAGPAPDYPWPTPYGAAMFLWLDSSSTLDSIFLPSSMSNGT
jgi:hypothetical protein